MLAKQLVQMRKQKNRTYAANSKISSVGMQNKGMGANIALAGAMKTTTKTMADMNKIMRPEAIAGDMRAFQMANMKMEMTDEMINESLDDMLTESGDESESDQIVSQVLDEIGIEISGKVGGLATIFFLLSISQKHFPFSDVQGANVERYNWKCIEGKRYRGSVGQVEEHIVGRLSNEL